MQTVVSTPVHIFTQPQRLVVPLFQRAYSWTEDDQWAPLWQDLRLAAERHLDNPALRRNHFLGAIVLQQQNGNPGALATWEVIDGQQRLTTLQLLFDATEAVMATHGLSRQSQQLEFLITNAEAFRRQPEDRFKVWPTDRDQAAFLEVMSAPHPVDHSGLRHRETRMGMAHKFFSDEVSDWLTSEESSPSAVEERAAALVDVMTSGIQLVVINLGAEEDSQEIFETLNARGTPLSSADLIKNLVFQRLAAEGADTEAVYRDHWRQFEHGFWDANVSVGRFNMPRISLFLNQWLVAKVGEEIGPPATYARFKRFLDHTWDASVAELLAELHETAKRYQGWIERAGRADADLDAIELAVYRTQALGIELLKPVLLWLNDPQRPVPPEQVAAATRAVESWLLRRSLLRLTTSDLGRVLASMISSLDRTPTEQIGEAVEAFLARLDSRSTYWPGDDELRTFLTTAPAYNAYAKARLRMYLEVVEDHARGFAGVKPSRTGSRVRRDTAKQIEHLMPRSWQTNWPLPDSGDASRRDAAVHRLGNLTLLTGTLNVVVSNGSWLGASGKAAALADHDVLLLNRDVRAMGASGWDEDLIDVRTTKLIDALLETFTVPDGHVGGVRDRAEESEAIDTSLADLVDAGLLSIGTTVRPRDGRYSTEIGIIREGGQLETRERRYDSPSGAARALLGRAANGWIFWRLDDGRTFADLRAEFRRSKQGSTEPGVDPFRSWIAHLPEARRAVPTALANWVDGLAGSGTEIIAETYLSGGGDAVLTPRFADEKVGLVSIWGYPDGTPAISLWRSVFERRAPDHIPEIERLIAPRTIGQGSQVKDVGPELLAALHDAYEAARHA